MLSVKRSNTKRSRCATATAVAIGRGVHRHIEYRCTYRLSLLSFFDMESVTPTPSRRPPHRSGWSQGLLESVFTTIIIGAIVVAVVKAVETFSADTLERNVDLDDDAGSVRPDAAAGYRLAVSSARLIVEEPTIAQRLATVLPVWLAAGTVGWVAYQLWTVARSLRDGDVFRPANVRLLRSSANIVLTGGLAAAAAHILVSLWFVEAAHDELPVRLAASGSLVAIPIALALGGLAEIFRRGTELRDDVEGLV